MDTTTLDLLAAEGLTINLDGPIATVLSALASVLLLWAAVKIFMAYASRSWGLMVTEVIAVLVVGWFIWTPNSAISTLQSVSSTVFGAA